MSSTEVVYALGNLKTALLRLKEAVEEAVQTASEIFERIENSYVPVIDKNIKLFGNYWEGGKR